MEEEVEDVEVESDGGWNVSASKRSSSHQMMVVGGGERGVVQEEGRGAGGKDVRRGGRWERGSGTAKHGVRIENSEIRNESGGVRM